MKQKGYYIRICSTKEHTTLKATLYDQRYWLYELKKSSINILKTEMKIS